MKKILLATVAIIGLAGAASAADLRAPVRPYAAPVYAPVFNWSGCYLGGYIGGAWNAENVTTTDLNFYSGLDRWTYDLDSSFIGGGTLGCNWQPVGSPFVFGIEGELGFVNLEGEAFDPFFANNAAVAPGIVSSTKVGDWYGMITGRLGYAWDRAMVYVKGGAAFVDVEHSVFDGWGGVNIATAAKDSLATWTLGGGLEYAFDWNWSLKAEYMYIGLDGATTCGVANVGGTFCWDHDLEGIHTAKVGLNYRFGGGAPLVARY